MLYILKSAKHSWVKIFAWLILALFALSPFLAICQKPKPVNDTFSITKGDAEMKFEANVLKNDIGTDKKVTSFRIRTTTYIPGKEVTIAGMGTVKITADGKITITLKDTFFGKLPEISYIVNNSLPGDGKRGFVITTITRQTKTRTFARILSRSANGRVILWDEFDQIITTGVLFHGLWDGEIQYLIFLEFPELKRTDVVIIDKATYDFLNKY